MSKILRFAVVVCVVAGSSTSPAIGQRCGQERWSVKTGTDSGAAQVNVANPQPANISDLIALQPPDPVPTDTRFDPTENTVFVVNATLTDYKFESGRTGDSDYHLVLMDDQGNTMIAEIPSPSCVGQGSPFVGQITNARAEFDAQLTAARSFQTANIPVQVTGVGFFDVFHNQHGVAPNVIELHPVLDIQFNPAPAANDFSLSTSTAVMHLHAGGSSSFGVAAAPSKGNTAPNTSFSVTGLPSGVTSRINADAAGKARVTLSAIANVPNGTYPIVVTGSANGRSHNHVVELHLSNAPGTEETEQWEYKLINGATEQDILAQSSKLGAESWELVSVVRVTGASPWRAFLKRPKKE